MEQQKPLPSAEASLKYMAWDVKRVANEQEKQTANWCLGQLPRMYQDFGQTYDSGLRLKILGLQRGVVGLVGKHVAGLQQHFDALNQVMGVEPDRVKRKED